MFGLFFLYDLLYTSFSSFKTEYIYDKPYKNNFGLFYAILKKMKSVAGCELLILFYKPGQKLSVCL